MMDFSIIKKIIPQDLNFFKKGHQSVAGIDIGSSSVKMVQLKRQKERAVLETYGELATAPYKEKGPVGQTVRLDNQSIIQLFKDIKKEAGITATKSVVSVPLINSFVITLKIPQMSEKDLEKAVPFEARKYIPVSLSDVFLNWQIIPDYAFSQDGHEDDQEKLTMNILLAAVYKDAVDKFKNIMVEAGFNLASFEIEIFSMARSILRQEIYPVLLIDFGASTTKMTVIERGISHLVYSVNKGSRDLTLALSRSLNIDFARAEDLKRKIGLSKKPEHKEISGVIEAIINYIFSDASHMILEYRKRYNRSVEKTLMSGGGSLLPGIIDFAVDNLGMQVEQADPFSKTQYPAFLETILSKTGTSFSNAIGLALKEL